MPAQVGCLNTKGVRILSQRNILQARLSRFALCIAPSTDDAYDALDCVSPVVDTDKASLLRQAFRRLLVHLQRSGEGDAHLMGEPPRSVVARFSYLPYHQRVAFALVVIEEFSIDDAAIIMGVAEDDVRALLLATRDFLFSNAWTSRTDA